MYIFQLKFSRLKIWYRFLISLDGLKSNVRGVWLTRKPEVLSSRQRKRTVKLRSRRWQLSAERASCSAMLDDSGGRNEFHMSWRCSSSRSSEWTSSYTDWCTMSDWKTKTKTPCSNSTFLLIGRVFIGTILEIKWRNNTPIGVQSKHSAVSAFA